MFGLSFLAVAAALVLIMFKVWGYPYDKATNKSTAPRSLVFTHRLLGYVYVAIYVYLMWDMVPRLWTYQVELPARTVAHLVLGIAIGGILIVKLSIVRFFKHMEATLVPLLGTALFLCTLVSPCHLGRRGVGGYRLSRGYFADAAKLRFVTNASWTR